MAQEEEVKKIRKIIVKACNDEAYRRRFKNDPKAVLNEEGIKVPEDYQVRVVENKDNLFNLVLPPITNPDQLSDYDMVSQLNRLITNIEDHEMIRRNSEDADHVSTFFTAKPRHREDTEREHLAFSTTRPRHLRHLWMYLWKNWLSLLKKSDV